MLGLDVIQRSASAAAHRDAIVMRGRRRRILAFRDEMRSHRRLISNSYHRIVIWPRSYDTRHTRV